VLDQDGLMTLFSPALQGSKLNLAALAKLERARRLFPPEVDAAAADPAPFLWVLTEKLTPKEKAALIRTTGMSKAATASWQALPARAKKLAAALQKADLKRPSRLYTVLAQVPAPDLLFLLYHCNIRIVHDRAKNYLQKYLPLAQEVTAAEVEAALAAEGRPADHQSPEFRKKYQAMVADRVDGKTRKPEPPPPPPLDPRTRAAVARAARGQG
jgi:acyl-CoA synthetase (AMP-forming)/AMP-acid ligase II